MGAYDRFKDTSNIMGVRAYILPGNHTLLVKRSEMAPSTNPQKKGEEKTVVEFKVIESDTMKVGSTCSLVEVESSQGYLGNILVYVAGLLGENVDRFVLDPDFDETFAAIFEINQISTGMLVRCTGQQVKTKEGGDYTAKTWDPVHVSEYAQFGLIAPEGSYEGAETADVPQDAAA